MSLKDKIVKKIATAIMCDADFRDWVKQVVVNALAVNAKPNSTVKVTKKPKKASDQIVKVAPEKK